MRSPTLKLLLFLLGTRVLLFLLPWLATALLFPEAKPLGLFEFIQNAWNRWDAPHYLYLAKHWYTNQGDEANFIVFFPLYPLLLKGVLFFGANPVLTAILTSSTLFVIGGYFFYRLVELDYSETVARLATGALAIFPTSYFFNAPYTESLFFFLFSTSFYAARKERWGLAGLLAGLGSFTRAFGVLLLPALLLEWFLDKNRSWKSLPLLLLPSLAGIGFYLWINQQLYADPFAFQKILARHWHKHFASPLVGMMNTWKIALSGGMSNYTLIVGWTEAVSLTLCWILAPWAWMKLRRSWAVFYLLSLLLISSNTFVVGAPRYLLSVPPLFVLIALAEREFLFRMLWRFLSVALLFYFTLLFVRGQWTY